MSLNARLKNKAFYPELNSLFFSYLLKIKKYEGVKCERLCELARQAIQDKNYSLAKEYSIAIIINYGVPGFILHHEVTTASLKKDEVIEQDVSNALTYLFLAKILFNKDPHAKEMMQQHMNGEKIFESNYFVTKQQELMDLWELDNSMIDECKNTAKELANRAIEKKLISPSTNLGLVQK